MNDVLYQSSLWNLFENVRVMPKRIGATELLIDKFVGWIVFGNETGPSHRHHHHIYNIVDKGPFLHFNGLWSENFKAHFRRGDTSQICGVFKKGKNFGEILLNKLRFAKLMKSHVAINRIPLKKFEEN